MTKLSDLGPPITGARHGSQPASEGDHFVCGQAVGWRDLRQVIWHEQPKHRRLDVDS